MGATGSSLAAALSSCVTAVSYRCEPNDVYDRSATSAVTSIVEMSARSHGVLTAMTTITFSPVNEYSQTVSSTCSGCLLTSLIAFRPDRQPSVVSATATPTIVLCSVDRGVRPNTPRLLPVASLTLVMYCLGWNTRRWQTLTLIVLECVDRVS